MLVSGFFELVLPMIIVFVVCFLLGFFLIKPAIKLTKRRIRKQKEYVASLKAVKKKVKEEYKENKKAVKLIEDNGGSEKLQRKYEKQVAESSNRLDILVRKEIKALTNLAVKHAFLTILRIINLFFKLISLLTSMVGLTTVIAAFGSGIAIAAVVAIITTGGFQQVSDNGDAPKTEQTSTRKSDKGDIYGPAPEGREERIIWLADAIRDYAPETPLENIAAFTATAEKESNMNPKLTESNHMTNTSFGMTDESQLDDLKWVSQGTQDDKWGGMVSTTTYRRGIGLVQYTDTTDLPTQNGKEHYGRHAKLLEIAEEKGGKWYWLNIQLDAMFSGEVDSVPGNEYRVPMMQKFTKEPLGSNLDSTLAEFTCIYINCNLVNANRTGSSGLVYNGNDIATPRWTAAKEHYEILKKHFKE